MLSKRKYEQWIKSSNVLRSDKIILKKMSKKMIATSFGKKFMFGTAGIRTYMGIGSSLLNNYTIKMIAYAWIKSLEKLNPQALKKPLIVGRDVRKNGEAFARIVAQVISGMGYQAIMFFGNKPVPTPLLSFAIKDLNLGGGACITASHNPPQYNGFKCFTNNGQHLMKQEANIIQEELEKININTRIPLSIKNITYLDLDYENHYLNKIIDCLKIAKNDASNLKIIFSPQHGASYKLGPQVLTKLGFNVIQAPKQSIPDENFSNTPDPNPENSLAFEEIILVGQKHKADLLLTTDPDGDRVGIGVLHNGDYVLLNGQEMATIITYHLLRQLNFKNKIKKYDYVLKSIVTTTLIDKICQMYNVKVKTTLTGFKYLGEVIRTSLVKPLLAVEESYGALLCPQLSLDKDSLQVLPFVANMTSYYKTKKMSLVDVLNSIYSKFNYYVQKNYKIQVASNTQKLDTLFKSIKLLKNVGNFKVKQIQDFAKGVSDFPKTQMVIVTLEDDSWIAMRPSGTEPLIRVYFCIKDKVKAKAFSKYRQLKEMLLKLIN